MDWLNGLERWRGRVALVTGATSGIGAATARALAQCGMNVALAGRRTERLEAMEAELRALGVEARGFRTDMRDEAQVRELFRQTMSHFGGLDVLINNAGLGTKGPIAETPLEDLREILDVNVLAMTQCMQEALKAMQGRPEGAILTVSSMLGHVVPPNRGVAMYSASKHAVRAVMEGLRGELAAAGRPIKLCMLSPGLTATEFQQVADRSGSGGSSFFGDYKVLDADDVAEMALYMLATPPHVQVNEIFMRPMGQPH